MIFIYDIYLWYLFMIWIYMMFTYLWYLLSSMIYISQMQYVSKIIWQRRVKLPSIELRTFDGNILRVAVVVSTLQDTDLRQCVTRWHWRAEYEVRWISIHIEWRKQLLGSWFYSCIDKHEIPKFMIHFERCSLHNLRNLQQCCDCSSCLHEYTNTSINTGQTLCNQY